MKQRVILPGTAAGAIVLSVALGSGVDAPDRLGPVPGGSGVTCTSGGCHAEIADLPRLHGPVAVDACDACHVMTDEAAHAFTLARPGAELCAFCHGDTTKLTGTFMHAPVEQGQCVECHDPHGSQHAMLMRGTTPGQACLECHTDVATGPVHHAPVAEGKCLSCHRAHASDLPSLLLAAGRDLCLSCHEGIVGATEGADPAVTRHPPTESSCVSCHEVHGSAHEGLLVRKGLDLCATCHEQVATHALTATVTHAPAVDEPACTGCHAPHESPHPPLLREDSVTTCLSCHAKDIARAGGRVVRGLGALTPRDDGGSVHAPILTDGCRGCHDAHGGERSSLLTADFPQASYHRFGDGAAYALCFSCHDRRLVDEVATAATGFRNGTRNLHAAHVNPGDRSGRSCRLCHDPHATQQPKLMRATSSFGAWEIPIGFKATATGGSCAAGCHQAQSYDRAAPVP